MNNDPVNYCHEMAKPERFFSEKDVRNPNSGDIGNTRQILER